MTGHLSESTTVDGGVLVVSGKSDCNVLALDWGYFTYSGRFVQPGTQFTFEGANDSYRYAFTMPVEARPQRITFSVEQIDCRPAGEGEFVSGLELTVRRAAPQGHATPIAVRQRRAFVLHARCFGSGRARWVPLVLVDRVGHRHEFMAQTFERRQVRAIVDVPRSVALGPATIRFANNRECPGVLRQPIAYLTVLSAQGSRA